MPWPPCQRMYPLLLGLRKVLPWAGLMRRDRKGRLRTGFTTGSAAAAAAKAALQAMGNGKAPERVNIPLPEEGRLDIPVERVEVGDGAARALVIKDAGDDPDVTHKAEIWCSVVIHPKERGGVIIKGGKGVGMVTKPGLPVPVGEPAINPAPRRQIKRAVEEAMGETGLSGTVVVTIDVPKGEELAKKTFNPRLGIMGGISILGTRGTVIPYSHEAYRETIRAGLDVARAQGLETIVFSTGGRSEKFIMAHLQTLPKESFVQIADFFAFSLKEAARRGFRRIMISCFFGKLVKMAQGYPYTHARESRLDFEKLAAWAKACGVEEWLAQKIASANTAREVLELVLSSSKPGLFISSVMERAALKARGFAGPLPELSYYLFSMEGGLLMNKAWPGATE